MTSVAAVIPTIGEAPQLPALVDRLFADGAEEVLLITNWPCRLPYVDGPTRRLSHNGTVYDSWNIGVNRAAELGADLVAVLNDDVELQPGALHEIVHAFELDPRLAVVGFDYSLAMSGEWTELVRGSYRHGGVGGFAFMVDPTKYPGVDERFEWWYGDDDLFFSVERAGHLLGIRRGAHVTHQSETTARNHPWTFEARARDAVRFNEKWGQT